MILYGGVPVPYTASWTAEDETFIGDCPYAGIPAIRQRQARGTGKPRFARPHFDRQRQVIMEGRCDLCAKPLRNRTRVSLSHARVRPNSASGADVLQVEPLLHAECAAVCIRHCPSLKRDLAAGSFEARVVTRSRVQVAISRPEFVSNYVPGYVARPTDRIAGHAKVELLASYPVTLGWLERKVA